MPIDYAYNHGRPRMAVVTGKGDVRGRLYGPQTEDDARPEWVLALSEGSEGWGLDDHPALADLVADCPGAAVLLAFDSLADLVKLRDHLSEAVQAARREGGGSHCSADCDCKEGMTGEEVEAENLRQEIEEHEARERRSSELCGND